MCVPVSMFVWLCNRMRVCVCVCQGTNKRQLISRPLAPSTSSTRTLDSSSLALSLHLSLSVSHSLTLSNTWQILFMATRAAFLKGAVQRLCRWEQSEGVFERLECTFTCAAEHRAISADEMEGGRVGGRLRARVQVSRYGRWPCNNNMKRRRQKDIIICFRGLEQFNCNCMDNCGQPSSARKKKSILFPLLFGFVTRPAWEWNQSCVGLTSQQPTAHQAS